MSIRIRHTVTSPTSTAFRRRHPRRAAEEPHRCGRSTESAMPHPWRTRHLPEPIPGRALPAQHRLRAAACGPAVWRPPGLPSAPATPLAAQQTSGATDRRRPHDAAPVGAEEPRATRTAVHLDRRHQTRRRAGTSQPTGPPRHRRPDRRRVVVAAATRRANRLVGRYRRTGLDASDDLHVPTLVRIDPGDPPTDEPCCWAGARGDR